MPGTIAAPGDPKEDSENEHDKEFDEPDWNSITTDRAADQLPGAQGLFWSSLAIVILLQVVIAGVFHYADPGGVIAWSFAAIVMLGPAYLLAACVVMAIRIGLSPTLRQAPGYSRATLKIFGAAFLGTTVRGHWCDVFLADPPQRPATR